MRRVLQRHTICSNGHEQIVKTSKRIGSAKVPTGAEHFNASTSAAPNSQNDPTAPANLVPPPEFDATQPVTPAQPRPQPHLEPHDAEPAPATTLHRKGLASPRFHFRY